MNIITVKDAHAGGAIAFNLIKDEMMSQKIKVLGLATGSTPKTLYQNLVNSDLDFSNIVSVNLDEYVGLSSENPQSYHYFMHEKLFNKKPFKQSFLPNGLAKDAIKECTRYEKILDEYPVDIQILGLGENAHIGFNEPGSSFNGLTSEVELTESTIKANSRNFKHISDVPTTAYSMGIGSILKAKKIILMAYGEKKADAVYNMVKGPITEDVPASILQMHQDVTIIIDEKAAQRL